jgi:hypothetical protein
MLLLLMFFLLQVHCTIANTEKVIFLGPEHLHVPLGHPTLEDLQLEALSPQHWTLRTHIEAEFPSESSKYGHSSWYLLHRLQEGQRYEVRICWAATVSWSAHVSTLLTCGSNPLPSVSKLTIYPQSLKHQN